MEKRYQVVTWSSDTGSDGRMDYTNKKEAIRNAKKYREAEEYAAIFDRKAMAAFVVFGNIETEVFSAWVKVYTLN